MSTIMEEEYREVWFNEYCPKCVYWETPDEEMPCTECLEHPANLYSRRPYSWKGKSGYEDYLAPERDWVRKEDEK